MSKKIACGSDFILLDVKVGNGAFMKDIEHARQLAHTMIAIGRNLERKVGAIITDMNQPLGRAVGNALEVREAIETLAGSGPADLTRLCVELTAALVNLADPAYELEEARSNAEAALKSGAALDKFAEIIRAQDGDEGVITNPCLLPVATIVHPVTSEAAGIVCEMDTAGIGRAASALGAGRERKEDAIDPAVGVVIQKKIGDTVAVGDTLAVIHGNDPDRVALAEKIVRDCYKFGSPAGSPQLILERM